MRRNNCLTKYFNKLLSYGDQHRTSQYLKHWKDNQRLKRNNPFSQTLAQNLSFNVEHHCLTSFINPVLALQGITCHYNLMPNVNKMSDHSELLKQLTLEVIDGIPLGATKLYTDDRDLAFSEIWILTDSQSSIQHLSNWPTIGDSTSRSILHLFEQLSDWHPIHLQCVPSHVGFLGNEVADDLAKPATSNPVDLEDHMILTSTEIYSRAKELICITWVVPSVHPCKEVAEALMQIEALEEVANYSDIIIRVEETWKTHGYSPCLNFFKCFRRLRLSARLCISLSYYPFETEHEIVELIRPGGR
ncbi:RNase H domain-containing protein [Trichonephila clavipes]|nr:RNase H domain-containing protein [Trichonephila clavipes]